MARTADVIRVEMKVFEESPELLSSEQVQKYEALESELASFHATSEIKKRGAAYELPRVSLQPASVVQGSRDDGRYTFDKYLRGDMGAAKEIQSYSGAPNLGDARLPGYKLLAWPREDQTFEQYAQTETTTGGGYTIPTLTEKVMIKVKKAFGGISAQASHINTGNGDPLNFPSIDDTANSSAIAAINAAPGSGGADLSFGTVAFTAFKYAATGTGQLGLKVPRELVDDSLFDITSLVTEMLGIRLARKMASDYAVGIGTTAPSGLMNRTGTTTGSSVASTGLVQATANAQLQAFIHLLDPAYINDSCVWIMNWLTHGIISGFVDSTNRPLMIPYASSGLGSPPAYSLLGYPVVIDQGLAAFSLTSAANPGSVNTGYAAFGDISEGFMIRDVQGVGIAMDPYTGIGSNQVLYYGYARTDSQIRNSAAYETLNGYHV